MAGDVVTYDTIIGEETVDGFMTAINNVASNANIDVKYSRFGTSGGPSFDRMEASFTTFEDTINTRITEHRRIGEIVGSMLAGVHERISKTDAASADIYKS